MSPKRAAVVIILSNDDSEVLLLERSIKSSHHQLKWENPGGHCEEGEDFEQAAEREVLEEIGVRPYGLERVIEKSFVDDEGRGEYQVVVFTGKIDEEPRIVETDTFSRIEKFKIVDLAQVELASYVVDDFTQLGWL